jgi:hypothetical protein
MEKNNWLTKSLALAGTVLVAIPMLTPIVFSIIRLISLGDFKFDYLMPAEIGLLVIIGAALLIWAAIRSRSHLKWIIWITAIAMVLVFGGQGLAMITGLATGKIDASGWQYGVVLAAIMGYDLAVVGLVVVGILLSLHVFRSHKK